MPNVSDNICQKVYIHLFFHCDTLSEKADMILLSNRLVYTVYVLKIYITSHKTSHEPHTLYNLHLVSYFSLFHPFSLYVGYSYCWLMVT